MTKAEKLYSLKEEIEEDKSLPLQTNLVFGEGNMDCEVLFVGEAPGEEEDKQKRPFVGRSGQLLTKMIESLGWKREDVYITNIVKRRPPENRDPLPEEIEAYKPYLSKQIEIINPKIIVTLGRFSMNYFLPEAKISKDQGTVFRTKERVIIPFFHPAAVLRGMYPVSEYQKGFKRLVTVLNDWSKFGPQAKKA